MRREKENRRKEKAEKRKREEERDKEEKSEKGKREQGQTEKGRKGEREGESGTTKTDIPYLPTLDYTYSFGLRTRRVRVQSNSHLDSLLLY